MCLVRAGRLWYVDVITRLDIQCSLWNSREGIQALGWD